MAIIALRRPNEQPVSKPFKVGDRAPEIENFTASKPYVYIAFIRHVGCPFAEATIKHLNEKVNAYPDIEFIVVSHGDEHTTRQWIESIGGFQGIKIIIDASRETYGKWGLGYSDFWHFAGLKSMLGVLQLALKGSRNRSASGTRWQKAGAFLLTSDHKILWKHTPLTANQIPSVDQAVLSAGLFRHLD